MWYCLEHYTIVEEAAVLFCSRSNQQQQRPSSLYIVGQQRSCQGSLPVLILFYPVDQSLSVLFSSTWCHKGWNKPTRERYRSRCHALLATVSSSLKRKMKIVEKEKKGSSSSSSSSSVC